MSKRITKSEDEVFDGCLAGIAKHFGWDPFWLRLIFTILTFGSGFPGILIYFILMIIMPER